MSPIRLIAVRETGVSRQQGGLIEDPPEIPRTHQSTIVLRELRGYLTWAPKEMEIQFSQCTTYFQVWKKLQRSQVDERLASLDSHGSPSETL